MASLRIGIHGYERRRSRSTRTFPSERSGNTEAERRMGELLREQAENGERRTQKDGRPILSVASGDTFPKFPEQCITRDESSRYQKLPSIPEETCLFRCVLDADTLSECCLPLQVSGAWAQETQWEIPLARLTETRIV